MLTTAKPMAFVATADPEKAKAFYSDVLGLTLVADQDWSIIYDLAGTRFCVQKGPKTINPHPYTAFGWIVSDVPATVAALQARGVKFERFPGVNPDSDWWSPGGPVKVAWFKDPDGNVLSLTEG